MYASAQSLDFLARRKNPRFPKRKPTVSHPVFPDGNYLIAVYVSPFIYTVHEQDPQLVWSKHRNFSDGIRYLRKIN